MSLFGVDIKSLVTDAFAGQLRPITLTRTIEGEYDPVTDQTTSTTETYTTEGIEENRSKYLEAGLIASSEVPVLMLAQPLGTAPKAGDKIEIEQQVYTMTGIVERDPAGATWIVRAEQ